MKRAAVVSILAVSLAAGCGSGSGSSPAPPATAAAQRANFTMSIGIPNRRTSAGARSPQYVSDGTMALAVYDGATLVYVANLFLNGPPPTFSTLYAKSGPTTVTPGDCVRGNLASTCTLTINANAGSHTFGMTAYGDLQGGVVLPGSVGRRPLDTGTPPTFTGLILSEGELTMTVVAGPNPAQTITLLGVADIAQWFGNQTASFNQTATIGYAIQDARSGQIVQPGTEYDNGPITITVSPPGIVSFTPISQTTPPATNGSQTFNVTCTSSSGGDVTFTASAGTHPTHAWASGLTYDSTNYSSGTLSTRTFRCFGS